MISYEDLGKLNAPFFEDYKQKVDDLLKSGWFILGNNVKSFEREFADYCGTKFCAGVATGLDALLLAIKAFDFPPDAEIITPSNTYIATILAIVNAGYKPVLVEPDILSYNIDPEKIQEKITERTRAVLVVHLYGKVCSMDKIIETCLRNDLKLIEDCAQAHGASYKGSEGREFRRFGSL